MARRLSWHAVRLDLSPRTSRIREGLAVGVSTRSDEAAVVWEAADATNRFRGAYADARPARARLASPVVTDATYDTGTNGARTVRTPPLTAAGVREWRALEVVAEVPAGADLLVRIVDLDAFEELSWTGAAWVAQAPGDDDPATWTTIADAHARFAELSPAIRSIAVLAWLRSTTAGAGPEFYGAVVVFGCRQVSAADDALARTLVASLRAEVRASLVYERAWPAGGVLGLAVPDAASGYDVDEIEAAYNLTADPDEVDPLAGAYAGGTWTPVVTPDPGDVVRVEARYAPDVVLHRHVDALQLARVPAIYLGAQAPTYYRTQGGVMAADRTADPPTGVEVHTDAERVTIPLDVRVVAELEADADRLAAALGAWLARRPDGSAGAGLQRVLVSPETGEIVTVRALGRPGLGVTLLGEGLAEVRLAWAVDLPGRAAHDVEDLVLLREGGATLDATGG